MIKLPQLRVLDKDQYEPEDFEEAKDIKEERRVRAEVEAAAKAAAEAAAQLKAEEAEQEAQSTARVRLVQVLHNS